VRGCKEGHCFCKPCYVTALLEKKSCPACRENVDESKLLPNRELEGVVAKLRMRCPHAAGGKEDASPPAAKRAKLAPAAFVTMEELRKQLRERFLEAAGSKAEMEARLEEDRKKRAGCGWKGRVAELPTHLKMCDSAPVECPKGCTVARKDLPQHDDSCGGIEVKCSHCEQLIVRRSLVEHEGACIDATSECPNEGCSVEYRTWAMNQHRTECEREEVTCPCPGCETRLLREDLDAHVEAMHLGDSAGQQLQRLWRVNAELMETAEIERIHAAASPTSWVFNWRADGWVRGFFESETHDFGQGVMGECTLSTSERDACGDDEPVIGFTVSGRAKCRVHATFSLLDKHNATLRQVCEIGTADAPREVEEDYECLSCGNPFTPTADEKAQSVRADGSIRLRAVVRLFLD